MLANEGITINLTPNALQFIARQGFDPQYGARPVKRAIQHYLLNDLSKQMLAGTVSRDSRIEVDENEGRLTFSNL